MQGFKLDISISNIDPVSAKWCYELVMPSMTRNLFNLLPDLSHSILSSLTPVDAILSTTPRCCFVHEGLGHRCDLFFFIIWFKPKGHGHSWNFCEWMENNFIFLDSQLNWTPSRSYSCIRSASIPQRARKWQLFFFCVASASVLLTITPFVIKLTFRPIFLSQG